MVIVDVLDARGDLHAVRDGMATGDLKAQIAADAVPR